MFFKNRFSLKNPNFVFLILLILSIVLLCFQTEDALFQPKRIGITIFSSVQHGIKGIGNFFSRTITSIRELNKLRSEYNDLVKQIKQYKTIETDYKALQAENIRLKNVLGFSDTIKYSNIPAEIIGKDPENVYSTITINKGKLDGIKKHSAVISVSMGVQGLVGKVVEVGANTSHILPIFDQNCYVAARFEKSRHEGLVKGNGLQNGNVTMQYVKKNAKNEIGFDDLIITSGMNSLYPKGIPIGKVKSIKARDYDTSLQIELSPIVDFSKLEYVFVINIEE